MNQYTCCFCGNKNQGHGHNPEPLGASYDRCCDDCNTIFVMAARFTGIDCMKRQIIYLNEMEADNDLPMHIITKKDEVWEYLYDCRDLEDEAFDENILEYRRKEREADIEEEVNIEEPLNPSEMQRALQAAYDNAIKNEAYEAASIIWNRLQELKS
tara:strand:+ start:725 stop:1192 length:468 start_codon:yes stop_codon:yes gene_type:complete